MTTITIQQRSKTTFILLGLGLDDARDLFAAYDVVERFGQVEVEGATRNTVQQKLRDAGYRTKVAA